MSDFDTPMFWLERLALRIHVSYGKLAILIPSLVVSGHVVIALFTSGLLRAMNDAGFIQVFLGWFLILMAIKRYMNDLRKLLRLLPDLADYGTDEIARIHGFIHGKGMYAFGILAIGLCLVNSWIMRHNSPAIWTELPYKGGISLGMVYTSIPAWLWGTAFWAVAFFIGGGILWMCVANVIFMSKLAKDARVKVDLIDSDQLTKLRAVGDLALSAVLMPTAGLVLTPAVFSLMKDLPNAYWLGIVEYSAFTLFLATVFGLSVYEIHLLLDRHKRNDLDKIRRMLKSIYHRTLTDPDHIATDADCRQLFLLRGMETEVERVNTWPFDQQTAYQAIALLLAPALSALVQYLLSSVLK